MLFIYDTVKVQDLVEYEEDIASLKDFNIEAKIRRAQERINEALTKALEGVGNFYTTSGYKKVSAMETVDLKQVVTTPPLKLWFTFEALSIAYRDAYNRSLEDEYLAKWKEYKELAGWASTLLFQTGIGISTREDRQVEIFKTVPTSTQS